MPKLVIEDLHLRYGPVEVLKGIDARFEEGSVVCLLGRSGSGKTTLLRSIAGLEEPYRGAIRIDGRPVYDAGARVNLPPEKRDLGFVFQSYALWPHRTVFENVAYGLRLRREGKAEIAAKVQTALDGVGLGALAARYPSQLSGGQQQRVAIARALVYEPPVILLDEPLSNLDAKLREEARIWIRALIKRRGITAVFVTHDQSEALAIADQIVLLDGGRLVQSGTPEDLYERPETAFASEFMGSNNTLTVAVEERREGRVRVALDGHSLWGLDRRQGPAADGSAKAVIRLEAVRLAEGPGENRLPAAYETSIYLGSQFEHLFRCGDQTVRVLSDRRATPGPHWLECPPERLWVF
ncbi:ABC transporter ATP-binding protein [Methylobacterium isbiliense]|jgi:iron(III) transport system ATP-binding protein|uniref:Vitamin B12 import ATP-binding protein BtuD n=1 Tax=Methylobacterium isbiliense TaxID=315478 RepID=A0ABQ4S4Z2_9HYPH|nr:ABC transporter ATP-binding protein [Methylobacterium isbiliense]MDN3623126.1 ABC transporter ATP-binding protein [Methylobacterium isbiliense]GJD98196.1 Vitamin B12 import ATP-binding protein BtuD [Methylobacterium isbiliense]